jgi:hypothetical protein
MAESKPKPVKKKEEEKKKGSKGPGVITNILVGVALLTTIAIGFLLAKGKIRLDFLYGDTTVVISKESLLADSLRADSIARSEDPDFGIESGTSAFSDAPRSPDGRNHVIAGVFYNKVLCDRQVARLKAKGLDPVLLPFTSAGGNTFYRISVFASDGLDEAVAKRDEITGSSGVDCWVLK